MNLSILITLLLASATCLQHREGQGDSINWKVLSTAPPTAAPDRHISFSKVNDPKGIRTPVNRRLAEPD